MDHITATNLSNLVPTLSLLFHLKEKMIICIRIITHERHYVIGTPSDTCRLQPLKWSSKYIFRSTTVYYAIGMEELLSLHW